MKDLEKILTDARIIPALTDLLAPGSECWLVGGALRDRLLGRPVRDFDITTPGDPSALAQRFAGRIGGKWFLMDKIRRQSRVILKEERIVYDFAPFRAHDLRGDLRLRDFTINALAFPLFGKLPAEAVDLLGARRDLERKQLRACSEWVFFDDPLRVLKGVRHAAELGFCLEDTTGRLMAQAAKLLGRVAPERIRAELAAIFAAPSLAESLPLLHALELDRQLFGPSEVEDGFGGGLRFAVRMERITRILAADPVAADLLAEEAEAGLSRRTLLKLAAFLRGYAPYDTPGLCTSLRLGSRAKTTLKALTALPRAFADDMFELPTASRARALWAASVPGGPIDAVVFLALFMETTEERATTAILPVLHAVSECLRDGRIPDLVDGLWLRKNLGLEQGPEIGQALEKLRHEEIAGRVQSIDEARKFLNLLDKKMIDKAADGTL